LNPARPNRLTAHQYTDGVLSGNIATLSQAISMIESKLSSDKEIAETVLNNILPSTGNSIRIGVTGSPGVGKSMFIESLGTRLANHGKRLAVLAVDPTSRRTKGSIMGDKTRMLKLSRHPNAYIRPAASGGTLGGVTSNTHEIILLCEAAGYEIIIVETVGIGQSETIVYELVDFFMLLILAGAGDELQGIKKGVMELADAIVINKADSGNEKPAQVAKREYQNALRLFIPPRKEWKAPVMTCSALNNSGIEEVWEIVEEFKHQRKANGAFEVNREEQMVNWLKNSIRRQLLDEFYAHEGVQRNLQVLTSKVRDKKISVFQAKRELLSTFRKN